MILDSPSDVRLHDQLDSYCLDRRMSDHDESVALERKLVWRSGRGGTFERDVSDGKIDRVQDLKCVL